MEYLFFGAISALLLSPLTLFLSNLIATTETFYSPKKKVFLGLEFVIFTDISRYVVWGVLFLILNIFVLSAWIIIIPILLLVGICYFSVLKFVKIINKYGKDV